MKEQKRLINEIVQAHAESLEMRFKMELEARGIDLLDKAAIQSRCEHILYDDTEEYRVDGETVLKFKRPMNISVWIPKGQQGANKGVKGND